MSLRSLAGKVSDAIPNEFSKLNSFNKYTKMIPVYGQIIGAVLNGISAADRFGETYSNGGSLMDSAQYGMGSFQDSAGDPNMYSDKNRSLADADWWLRAGRVGEMAPGGKGAGSFGSSSLGSAGSLGGYVGNGNGSYYENLLNMGSMFGGSKKSIPSLDIGRYGSDGQYLGPENTGTNSWSNYNLGDIANFASQITNSFNRNSQHINSDGSTVYGPGGPPTVNSETGADVNGGIDVSKIFELFRQSQAQAETPEQQAAMIQSRYPFIPQEVFSKWLEGQPTSYQLAR